MDKQIIITIGREYGSGGSTIAKAIAKDLGLPLYDRNILAEIFKGKETSFHEYEKYNEKPRNFLLSRTVRGETSSIEHHLAEMQFNFLREKADSGESFVVLGRCAEEILKDYKGIIKIFILGDHDFKKKIVMDEYELSADEALAKMKRKDKYRKQYHNSYSSYKWGDSRGYDLCINTARLGVEGTTAELLRYIHTRMDALND